MERTKHLFRSSVLVISLFALGKLTGVIRTRLVSTTFGATQEFDAFVAANQLPEVFVTIISGGALAAAFIPIYSRYINSKKAEESALLASSVLTLVSLTLVGLSVLGIIFAPAITRNWLVSQFTPEMQDLTAQLMRVILIQITLFGISGVLSSILNAHQHFALPALAPVSLDIGYLIGLLLFEPSIGIFGLAWGTVVGGLLHIAIQVPALLKYRFRFRPSLGLSLPGVRDVIRLMGPRIVTLGSIQIVDLFIINFTAPMQEGTTTGYFYGYSLMQLPETLLGTAIAIAIFPTMSELFNKGDKEGLKRTAISTLRIIWTLTIPAAAALILLGRQAITLLLEGGAFTPESTLLVYRILVFFSLRLVSEASLEILARLFYARHDTKTPMYVALGWLVTNISLAYVLVGPLGERGLALASSMAFTLQAMALFVLNRHQLGPLYERELAQTVTRSLIGAGAMSVVILITKNYIEHTFLLLATAGVLGMATYLIVTYLVGSRELPTLISMIRHPSKTHQE